MSGATGMIRNEAVKGREQPVRQNQPCVLLVEAGLREGKNTLFKRTKDAEQSEPGIPAERVLNPAAP